MTICALGDLLVDVIARLEAPLARAADTPAQTRIGVGGQAANVAAWIAHLAGPARLVAVRPHGGLGPWALAEMQGRGVEVVGPDVAYAPGMVVAMVDAEGERTMITDRGAAVTLREQDVQPEWFAGAIHLHLSGYSLLRSPIDRAALRAVHEARAAGARVSVDLSSWSAIRDFGPERFLERLVIVAPDVIFANEEEVEVVGGVPDAPVVAIKRGADGCEIRWAGGSLALPADPANVVDTTGAGDAFAAGFLLGTSAEDAARRALAAAAACVGQMGAMPLRVAS